MKIIADSQIPFIKNYFDSYGELILKPGRLITHDDVLNADILLVRSITHVDEKLLSNSKVKFVGSVTAGADHIDVEWLKAKGIQYNVAIGFNAPPVADFVLSTIAALQKKGLLTQKKVKAAVVGVGNVGRLVVERFRYLNFEIILTDPIRREQEPDFISTPLSELEDVDLISLHVPLVKLGEHPTYHFIDKTFLQKQKKGCILINASRGSVINSKELLEYGNHLHWCFDVWEHEPKIDKVILEKTLLATPHIAGYSLQSKIRGIDMIYQIMCEKKLINPEVISPITPPLQQLEFAGEQHDWQDIVLGVFNPTVITTMMNTILLPAKEYGPLFDEMRNQFNYRYEFNYTEIVNANVSMEDRQLLTKLGLHLT